MTGQPTLPGTPDGGTLDLVRGAILAANAPDSLTLAVLCRPDHIDLYANMARNLGSIDPYRREMRLSLGCALENLLIAATLHGYTPQMTLLHNPHDATQIATINRTSWPPRHGVTLAWP